MTTTDPLVVRERSDARAAQRLRLREGIAYCLKVFVAVRVGLFVVVLVSVALLPSAVKIPNAAALQIPGPVGVPGWPAHC